MLDTDYDFNTINERPLPPKGRCHILQRPVTGMSRDTKYGPLTYIEYSLFSYITLLKVQFLFTGLLV